MLETTSVEDKVQCQPSIVAVVGHLGDVLVVEPHEVSLC